MVTPGNEKGYDLNKWYDCEKKVAAYINEGHSFEESVKYASKPYMSNDQEVYDFYHWVKNRSTYKTASVNKEAIYYTPLNFPNQSDWKKEDLPEKTFEAKKNFEKSNDDATYKKLKRYIIGLNRVLLESDNISEEDYESAYNMLGKLTRIFKGSYSKQTKADYAYSAANKILKMSNNTIGKDLIKFAQEVEAPGQPAPAPQQVPPQNPQAQPAAPAAPESPDTGAEVQEGDDPGNNLGIPSGDEVKPVRFEDIKAPDHDPDRYDDLAGDIDVADAAKKLDEIAGMLADRRVIRLLAEFDIMLDRLGVASMFPELAESQSKLIDAFSYALTRVTKMMGQLANAQQVIQSHEESKEDGTGLPGQENQS